LFITGIIPAETGRFTPSISSFSMKE